MSNITDTSRISAYYNLNRRRLLGRTGLLTGLALLVVAGYCGLVVLLNWLVPAGLSQLFTPVVLGALLLLFLLSPLQRSLQALWNPKNQRNNYPSNKIPDLSTSPNLTTIEELLVKLGRHSLMDEQVQELVEYLQQNMQLTFAAFTLYYEVDKIPNVRNPKFVGDRDKYFGVFEELTFRPIEFFNVPQLARTEIHKDNYQVCIVMKLRVGSRDRGFLCLGPREDGSEFQPEDIVTLGRLAEPIATMVGNTLRLKELEDKIALLEESSGSLQRNRDELQLVNQRVVQIAENERNRLAGDLQNEPMQKINQMLEQLEHNRYTLTEREILLWHLAKEARQAMYLISSRLRPAALDEQGLPSALEKMVLDIQQRVKLAIKLKISRELHGRRFSSDVELGLCRVAQEALENVLKHSRAHHVTVNLTLQEETETVRLVVLDDGVGFITPGELTLNGRRDHLGLAGMQERISNLGGKFEVRSSPGAGAIVKAEVPLRPVLSQL